MLSFKEIASMSTAEFVWWSLTQNPFGQILLLMMAVLLICAIASETGRLVEERRRRKERAELRQRFEAEFSDMPETERKIKVWQALQATDTLG